MLMLTSFLLSAWIWPSEWKDENPILYMYGNNGVQISFGIMGYGICLIQIATLEYYAQNS